MGTPPRMITAFSNAEIQQVQESLQAQKNPDQTVTLDADITKVDLSKNIPRIAVQNCPAKLAKIFTCVDAIPSSVDEIRKDLYETNIWG